MHLRKSRLHGEPVNHPKGSSVVPPPTDSSPYPPTPGIQTVESDAQRKASSSEPSGIEGRWKPLRSARKAAAAAIQKRSSQSTPGSILRFDEDPMDHEFSSFSTDFQKTQSTDSNFTENAGKRRDDPFMKAISDSQFIPSYTDNFTFAPLPDFVPISSCDDLVDPPDFDSPSDLKMSNNFSKLILNAKKVDQVRAQAKRSSRPIPTIDAEKTAQDIMEQEEGNLTIEEAQKRLIEQLKQGLNFLSKENKELTKQRNGLEVELKTSKERIVMKQKEVEERNLKLAVLEHHFRILNNHALNDPLLQDVPCSQEPEEHDSNHDESMTTNGTLKENDDDDGGGGGGGEQVVATTTPSTNHEEVVERKSAEESFGGQVLTPVAVQVPVMPTASSSIIQIDKGYYMELEATIKKEKARLVKMQKVNEDLAMKYAVLERDTQNALLEMSEKIKSQENVYQEQISRQELTIQSLEESLRKSRDLLFKKGKKSHRRRATVSALPTEEDVGMDHDHPDKEQDEASVSVATFNSNPTESEQEHRNQEKSEDLLQRSDVKDAIAAAVKDALEEQAKEHRSLMDVLSKQLEVKDNHISSLETKMFSMLKTKNESRRISTPQRTIPQDMMIRGMAVTNELLDSSMRKLESLMAQMNRDSVDTFNGMVDEMSQIRRVATKMALLQEEMKISMKVMEQKIQNGSEMSSQQLADLERKIEGNHPTTPNRNSGESQDCARGNLTDDMVTTITQSLQETEISLKDELGKLKTQLESIEFDLAAKNDTIEALELACAEHVENYRALQKEFESMENSKT